MSRWFRSKPAPVLATRMTASEVLEVARAAAADEPFFAAALGNPVARRSGEGVVWTVASMTLDSSLEIEVDDATGRASTPHFTRPPRQRE